MVLPVAFRLVLGTLALRVSRLGDGAARILHFAGLTPRIREQ